MLMKLILGRKKEKGDNSKDCQRTSPFDYDVRIDENQRLARLSNLKERLEGWCI